MVTRAKRAGNNKWDKENMKVLSCKVRRELAEDFQEACRRAGTTPNAVFRQAMEKLIEETGSGPEDAGKEG